MRILLTGATGALGRPMTRALVARGHEVVGLARSTEAAAILRALGATPSAVDPFDAVSLARAAQGADVLVRAATSIPTAASPAPEDWATNDRLRREGTRALLEAARMVGASHVVQESVVWLARPPDGAAFDESSPIHPDLVTASAADAEALLRDGARDGLATTTLRLGWLYGDTAHTRAFAAGLRAGALPTLGEAPLAFLHAEDAASAFVAAIERRASGTFHVVDDTPTSVGEYLRQLARRIGAPAPADALVGGPFLNTPMRTSARAFKAATGWAPRYPSVREGLDAIVAGWAQGALPASGSGA